jgi:hypothetical protein
MPEPELHARKIVAHVPACDTGQHIAHPGLTCEQADEQIAHERAVFEQFWGRQYVAARTLMADVPPALRGPNWKP